MPHDDHATAPAAPNDGDALRAIYHYRAVDDRLGSSGQPTEAQLASIAAAGYSTVINLALHDDPRYALPDEPGTVRRLGMDYVHIPVQFATPTDADLRAFFDAMDARTGQRVWIHCAANYRVTAFLGLYRVLRQGWTEEAAFAPMRGMWEPNAVWTAFIAQMLQNAPAHAAPQAQGAPGAQPPPQGSAGPAADVIGIDHIYITVSDMARSEAFYDRVLQQTLGFRKNGFTLGGDPHLQYYNRLFGFVLRPSRVDQRHAPYAPGLHHFCLRVESIDDVRAVAARLRALGIAATEERLYPDYAPDYSATFFEDPDGVRLEVTNYRQERRDRFAGWPPA